MGLSSSEILSVSINNPTSGDSFLLAYSSIESLYLIEDIFSLSVTGKLRFRDRAGVVERLPISGNEQILISYGNSDDNKFINTIAMSIFKIDKIEQGQLNDPTNGNIVEMTLVDQYFNNWSFNVWSKAWVDTNTDTIIKDICENFVNIKDFHNFNKTKEVIKHFDTHNRTAAESVEWLMNRSSDAMYKSPGYLLYNTTLGTREYKHNFVTLESLLSNSKMMEPKGDDYIYGFEQSNKNYINKIKHHKWFKVDNNALKTIAGGRVLGYNIMEKKLIDKIYNYKDAIDKFTILGEKSLFTSDIEVIDNRINIDGYYDEDMLDNLWYGNWIKEYCNQQLLDIVVLGNENRHAGGMITIHWPSYDTEKNMYNTQFKGKYLVKSVTNIFGDEVEGGWMQKMTLIKNGYNKSPNSLLVSASKMNI